MIAWFPDLLPGELFYSACARYKQQLGYRDVDVNRELFSKDIVRPRFLSPFEFSSLTENLPASWLPPLESLLRKHSVAPVVLPKISDPQQDKSETESEVDALLKNMERERYALGYAFCPECVRDDFENYGTSYWHREHNVQGVFVCVKHKVFLEFTNIRMNGGCLGYHSAPKIEEVTSKPRNIDLGNAEHKLFLQWAEDIDLLLDFGLSDTYREQVKLAIRTGLRTYCLEYNGKASVNSADALLRRTFSEELRLLLNFPQTPKPGIVSWCGCFTGNYPDLSVLATLLALYSFGMRPRIRPETNNFSRLDFIDLDEFVLEGGSNEEQRRPISIVLQNALEVPLGIPLEIRNQVCKQVMFLGLQGQRYTRLKELGVLSEFYQMVFVPEVRGMLQSLLQSKHRVTKQRLAGMLGVSPFRLSSLLDENNDLKSSVHEMLESEIEFAKRKIRMAREELLGQGEELTSMKLVYKTNTHVHYPVLKEYIKGLI
jgi:hypothetical protein